MIQAAAKGQLPSLGPRRVGTLGVVASTSRVGVVARRPVPARQVHIVVRPLRDTHPVIADERGVMPNCSDGIVAVRLAPAHVWVILECVIGSRLLVGIAKLPVLVLFLHLHQLVMEGWEGVALPAAAEAVGRNKEVDARSPCREEERAIAEDDRPWLR